MESLNTLDEFVCQICLDLLIDNKEEENEEPVAGPSRLAKRPRLVPDSQLHSTSCGHVFHKICISDWLKRKKECPSCRNKATQKTLRQIYLPLSSEGQCRKCKLRVEEVEGMKNELEDSRAIVKGMEEIQEDMIKRQRDLEGKVENLEEKGKEIEGLKGTLNIMDFNLEGKCKEVEELRGKVEEMEGIGRAILESKMGLEGKVGERDKEIERLNGALMIMGVDLEMKDEEIGKLKERVKDMEGIQKEMEGEVEELKDKVEEVKGELKREEDEREGKRKENEGLKKSLEEMNMGREVDREEYKRELKKIEEEKRKEIVKLKVKAERELTVVKTCLEEVKQENEMVKGEKAILIEREKGKVRREITRRKDWEAVYKLRVMEMDKERENREYYEIWCKRLAGIEEDSVCDILVLTEAMERRLMACTSNETQVTSNRRADSQLNSLPNLNDNEDGLSTSALASENLTGLEDDLMVSSDEENSGSGSSDDKLTASESDAV